MHALPLIALSAALAGVAQSELDKEPNDSFTQAGAIAVPLIGGHGCVDPATDIDMYTFAVSSATPLLVGTKSRGTARFALTLFDGQRQQVAKADDMLDVKAIEPGTYFISITALEKACYDLELLADRRLPPLG